MSSLSVPLRAQWHRTLSRALYATVAFLALFAPPSAIGAQVGATTDIVTGTVLYVSPDGNDENSGRTPAKPKKTIKGALDAVDSQYATLKLAAGTYQLQVTIEDKKGQKFGQTPPVEFKITG